MIAGSAGASLREPPAPRRPRVPLPRLPRAPPSALLLLLLPPQSPRLLRLGLSGPFIAPRGLPGTRTRAPRTPRVTPAPARPRVAGTSQQQPARRQPPAPRGARASCGAPRKLPLGRDSPKSPGAGIIPEKGGWEETGCLPCGTPGVQVPGQVCARGPLVSSPAISCSSPRLRSRAPAHPTAPAHPGSPPTRSPKAGLELSRPREEGSEPPQRGLLSRPSH